jgi:hypothetical protein
MHYARPDPTVTSDGLLLKVRAELAGRIIWQPIARGWIAFKAVHSLLAQLNQYGKVAANPYFPVMDFRYLQIICAPRE